MEMDRLRGVGTPKLRRCSSRRRILGDGVRAARLSSVFRLCSSLIRSVTGRGSIGRVIVRTGPSLSGGAILSA